MENREKRARGSNWNHEQTMALAELKREASLNKEYGPLVWERIAQALSSRFPGHIRTGAQCRRRWDTLVKVYNHIEDYCVVTGQDHRELDEGELASMELATAYHQDWYDIVEQVCSQRKRKESCDRDLRLAKRSKDSHSVDFSASLPNGDTLCPASTSKPVTHHDQSTPESTTTYAQVSPYQSLVADKLSPAEEFPRFENGNDGLVLEETQLHPRRQVIHDVSREPQTLESANLRDNQLPQTFPDEKGARLPSQDDLFWRDLDDILMFQISDESWLRERAALLEASRDFESGELVPEIAARSEELPPGLEPSVESGTCHRIKLYSPKWIEEGFSASRKSGAGVDSVCNEIGNTSMNAGGQQLIRQESVRIHISSDWTTSRQRRRWSLKVIVSKVRQCCHACGGRDRAEDMEMESKQTRKQVAQLREIQKKALMSGKENVPAMFNSASSTGALSATRGDRPLQKDTERASKPAASDKKEEESMSRKAERQQLGGKSSSKRGPVGKLCAKLSRKLFPIFRGQSSQ